MGSSPFTATILSFLAEFTDPGDTLLIAHSGGVDSTALLTSLQHHAPDRGVRLVAAHLDHALDPDSARRSTCARQIAAAAGVPSISQRLTEAPSSGDGLEDWARTQRYRFLRRWADVFGARWILTAHHADDQAETVLLRLLFGSGLEGLAGIRAVHGRVARPLLRRTRRELNEWVDRSGFKNVEDPTNRDLSRPRNLLRREILPRLQSEDASIVDRLVRISERVDSIVRRMEQRFEDLLDLRALPGGVVVDREALVSLPDPLREHALKWIQRRAGAALPGSAAANREFLRQLDRGIDAAGCDAGKGWRWECNSSSVCCIRCESTPGEFAYTVEAPGAVDLPELRMQMRLRRGKPLDWMFQPQTNRAGLSGLGSAKLLEIRNRRPGDRLIPFGGRHRRKLKDLLIDRRVPRHLRDGIPLLLVDGRIAWVPGVTIDERFRLDASSDEDVWIVELQVERERSEP